MTVIMAFLFTIIGAFFNKNISDNFTLFLLVFYISFQIQDVLMLLKKEK